MLVNGHYFIRVWYESVGELGEVYQSVFLDAYVDKCAEVGDVSYDCLLYTSDAADE